MKTTDYEVRKWLRSYKLLKKTISLKEIHLNDFVCEIYNPLKGTISRISRSKSGIQDPAAGILDKMSAIYMGMVTDLEKDIESIRNSAEKIFAAVNELDNYERSVCFCRYISGLSWNETAAKLGYETRQCQRYEERAIKKLGARYFSNKKTKLKDEQTDAAIS